LTKDKDSNQEMQDNGTIHGSSDDGFQIRAKGFWSLGELQKIVFVEEISDCQLNKGSEIQNGHSRSIQETNKDDSQDLYFQRNFHCLRLPGCIWNQE